MSGFMGKFFKGIFSDYSRRTGIRNDASEIFFHEYESIDLKIRPRRSNEFVTGSREKFYNEFSATILATMIANGRIGVRNYASEVFFHEYAKILPRRFRLIY